jgi:hypothetical protein
MCGLGARNPRLNFRICLGVTLAAWAFVAWGALEMHMKGAETMGSALKIGIGLLPAILGPVMAWNFWRGMKVFAAFRRGENVIARWTVTASDFPAFTAVDDSRNAYGGEYRNDWSAPRALPPSGLEIIFAADGALVGDTYFALVTTGIYKFTRGGMLSDNLPAIEFRTVMTWGNRFGARTTVGVLRLPAPAHAAAEAAKVVDHFRRVTAREIVINASRYRRLMRVGLVGAPICFAIAVLGYWLDGDGLPDLMLGLGILLGIAMLVLARTAWAMEQAQHRKP